MLHSKLVSDSTLLFNLFDILILVVAFMSLTVNATQKCNIYEMGTKGVTQCAFTWWRNHDLGQTISVKYNMTNLVSTALKPFIQGGINQLLTNYSMMAQQITGTTTPNFFAKALETGLTMEPFYTYVLAEAISGLELTGADLQRFGLPAELAEKANLVTMFTEYFDFSCGRWALISFT